MIALLKGILEEKSTNHLIINCGGVGYFVNISMKTYDLLPKISEICTVKSVLIPREDSLNLYGFINSDEKDIFLLLTSISGIGPKSALAILSAVSPSELQNLIINGNLIQLQKFPGIGKKTAERIILELKDKIIKVNVTDTTGVFISPNGVIVDEATSALISLGYNKAIAEKAVKSSLRELSGNDLTVDKLIRKALTNAMNV